MRSKGGNEGVGQKLIIVKGYEDLSSLSFIHFKIYVPTARLARFEDVIQLHAAATRRLVGLKKEV